MSEEIICQGCGNPIDECNCQCPYCGETSHCDCCCGKDTVTGG